MPKALQYLLLLLCLSLHASAQKASFQFYTIEDGLTSNDTWSIAQDQQGFLWFSNSHLSRYDGQEFVNQSKASHSIFHDFPAAQMVACGEGLVFYFENELFGFNPNSGEVTSIPLQPQLPKTEKSRVGVLQTTVAGDATLFIMDEELGVVHFYWIEEQAVTSYLAIDYAELDIFSINFSQVDADGNLYLANRNRTAIIKRQRDGTILQKIPFALGGASKMQPRPDGSMLFLLGDGQELFILERGGTTLQPHPVNDLFKLDFIGHFLPLENGDLWLSSGDRQLLHYDASTQKLIDYTDEVRRVILNPTDFWGFYEDNSGTVWVRSVRGLLKVASQALPFHNYFTERADVCGGHCSFRGIAEGDDGTIYAGFYNNIFEIPPGKEPSMEPLLPSVQNPGALRFDGQLLLNNGSVFDPVTRQHIDPFDLAICPGDGGYYTASGDGRFWLAWHSKVYVLDRTQANPKWKPVYDSPYNSIISELEYDHRRKKIWYSTSQELVSLDENSYEATEHRGKEDEFFLDIGEITLDGNGNFWIASLHGLVYYDVETKKTKRYREQDGLCFNQVNCILPEGDSCLWISTNRGLSRMHIGREEFINFYEKDGLPGNELNRRSAHIAKDGRYFFGGVRGITSFYPEEVMKQYKAQQKKGRLVCQSISMIDDVADTIFTQLFLPAKPELEVFHRNKIVSINFQLADFSTTGKARYSYLLDGYHKTWSNPSMSNTVTFSSLPSGHYTFRVRAQDEQGHWLDEELAIRLNVHPPWWATWWAYLGYLLILGGIGFGVFYVLRRRWELKAELHNEQQEAIRLKELDTFKSRLYTNLTHEFRTPLTVILGMAEELIELPSLGGMPAAQQRKMNSGLNLIQRNGDSLLRLVNQLLDLSKLESGTLQLHPQHGDFVAFTRYMVSSFSSFVEQRHLTLQFDTEMERLNMDFDPEQVQQVLSNLLSNAIKFTSSGGKIWVKVRQPELQTVSLVVQDSGIGIPAEALPNIFQRFYQVDGTSTRLGEGTGIGLAHAEELVQLMGGTISVESQVGKGTRFDVRLPVHQEEGVPTFQQKETVGGVDRQNNHEIQTPVNQSLATSELPQLLIIEDNIDLLSYLTSCLGERFHIEVARNGQVGIWKAIELVPDLILSDVMMPEKDGFEVVETLKADERTSHIPIVLLTAKADVDSKIIGLRQGADAYLSKPFHKEELLATLAMMLENRRRMQAHFSTGSTFIPQAAPAQTAPEQATVVEVEQIIQQEDVFVQKLRSIMEEHYTDGSFALAQLCDILGMNRYQLFRKMKAVANESPSQFIRSFRMQKAREFFDSTDMNVSEVAYRVGFKDLAHFSKSFTETFGATPSEYRKQ